MRFASKRWLGASQPLKSQLFSYLRALRFDLRLTSKRARENEREEKEREREVEAR